MKAFRTPIALTLTILVLLSSTSFMVGIHRCREEVKSIALFQKAEGCGHQEKLPPCHRQHSKPCCEDHTIVHEAQTFKADVLTFNSSPADDIIVTCPLIMMAEIVPTSVISHKAFIHYDTPLRSTDRLATQRVLLI